MTCTLKNERSDTMTSQEVLKDLHETLDRDTFMYLLQKYAGSTVSFPKNWRCMDRKARNEDIRQMYYNNFPVSEIAEKYGITVSAVYEVLRRKA
jgi:Mor family transcriptional regulator